MDLSLLNQVELRIREDSVPSGGTPWGGAGLIVTAEPGLPPVEGKVFVVSSYAGEISWVVFRMKEVFSDEIDYLNKYSFYPEMGRAALAAVSSGASRPEILLAVVSAAKDFWSDRPLPIKTEHEKALERLRRPAYFAYGSNLLHRQMEERCPEASFVGAGVVEGYRFFINERGYANIVPDADSRVYGGIYLMTSDDIASLDQWEGVATECYKKVMLAATATANGEDFDCLVYIDPRVKPGSPQSGYLEKILQGAKDCGLPREYVRFLRSYGDASA